MKKDSIKKGEDLVAYGQRVLQRVWGRMIAVELIGTGTLMIVLLMMGVLAVVTLEIPGVPSIAMVPPFLGISSIILLGIVLLVILVMYFTAHMAILVHDAPLKKALAFGFTGGLRSFRVWLILYALLLVSAIPSVALAMAAAAAADSLFIPLGLLALFLMALPIIMSLRSTFTFFIWTEQQSETSWSIIKQSFVLIRKKVFWILMLFLIVFGITISAISSVLEMAGIAGSLLSMMAHIAIFMPIYLVGLYALYEYAKQQSSTKKVKGKK